MIVGTEFRHLGIPVSSFLMFFTVCRCMHEQMLCMLLTLTLDGGLWILITVEAHTAPLKILAPTLVGRLFQ